MGSIFNGFFSLFLECLHNRKKRALYMSPSHITHVFSIEKMKPESWKMLSDINYSLWTFLFLKLHTFHYQRQEKWGEIWWGLKSWLSLLSLKSEVANDIAHRLYGTQSVRIGNIWISEEPLSISKWSYYLFMLFFTLWIVTNKIHFTLGKSNRSSHFPSRIILVLS